ncbi:multiple epidermal growth factor-like domains protein 8 isoform X1 [Clavelina lepadiformis]|uniref:multiple epidermal growth factor-like domains protein 8 isoform X1 n=1 Tax=Clavelina lepadiformis TaxID=159417 RepID=UPI004041D819
MARNILPVISTWWMFVLAPVSLLGLSTEACSENRTVYKDVMSGSISTYGAKYKSDQRCEWLIISPDTKNYPFITLSFTHKDTECTYDYIMVYEGSDYSGKLLGTLSGDGNTTSLPYFQAKSGSMLIYFMSDNNYERSGFAANFFIYSCPNNCSSQGRCLKSYNRCQCSYKWVGDDCSMPICPSDCYPHGTCNLDDGSKTCICNFGYIGIGCEMPREGQELADTFILVYNNTFNEGKSTGLAGHAGAYVDPYLWIFGGYDLNNVRGDLFQFNFTVNVWKAIETSIRPSPRFCHTMVSYDDDDNLGYLLMFGGNLGQEGFSNELWIFNISNSEWLLLENNLHSSLPSLAQHTSAYVHIDEGKFLYVFGGQAMTSSGIIVSSDMFRFNLQTRLWEQITYDPASVKSSHLRLAGHTMVYDSVSQSLVVFGGYSAQSATGNAVQDRTNQLYIFQLQRHYWLRIPLENSPKPVAFHSATIIGDYMLVFGGSVHTHDKDESCHDNRLHFYNLRCYSWHMPKVEIDGRQNHFAVASDNLLFLHGGYDGRVINKLHVYKVPTYVMPVTYDGREDNCRKWYHTEKTCLMDQRCAWCDMSHRAHCFNRFQGSCSADIHPPICEGVCKKVHSCNSCTSFSNYKFNSSYQWEEIGCGWCVPDAKCYLLGEPDENSMCGRIMTNSGRVWWDSMNNMLLKSSGSCLTNNISPGFLVLIYFNTASQNISTPDMAVPITNEFRVENLHVTVPQGEHQIIIKGFLHLLHTELFENLRFQLYTDNGLGKFYLSTTAGFSKTGNAQLITSSGGNSAHSSGTSSIVTITGDPQAGNRYYYKLQYSFSEERQVEQWSGSIHLEWTANLNWGNKNEFSVIKPEFLEPFHSNGNLCDTFLNCKLCVTDLSCAWSLIQSRCLSRQCIVGSPKHCTFVAGANEPYYGIITDFLSCPECADKSTCQSCLSNDMCKWNNIYGCSKNRPNFEELGVLTAEECSTSCHGLKTCNSCLAIEGCRWCSTNRRCYNFKQHRNMFLFGQCREWMKEVNECISCNKQKTCHNCLMRYGCGWCSSHLLPLQGKCVSGHYSRPDNESECLTNQVIETAFDWSYSTCQDVDECTEEWPPGTPLHNCNNNAECINSPVSFECRCKLGYVGDGLVCNRTCDKLCVHGSCSGPPDFECICNFGWTSNESSLATACDASCQCNFHSTCKTGIGACDYCHHNTMGNQCHQCLPRFYGNATSSQGCQACFCNGHGDHTSGLCDASTGACKCLHNTHGPNCQYCDPGYYGEPRNGGLCYQRCDGRTIFDSSFNPTEAFGVWNESQNHGSLMHCMWIVSSEKDSVIKLIISQNLHVDCMQNPILVYDGIPNSNKKTNSRLASVCGVGMKRDIILYAFSGVLSVLFEAYPYQTASFGFNAKYELLQCNSSASSCAAFDRVGNTCPNNCFSQDGRGKCQNGLCYCNPTFGGKDCSIHLPSLHFPLYSKMEWSLQDYMSSEGKSESNSVCSMQPPGLFGHSLIAEKPYLWLFGGFARNGAQNSLYRFDSKERVWTKIKKNQGVWPAARYWHASVFLPRSGVMLVHGGLKDSSSTFDDTWQLHLNRSGDTNEYVWKKIDRYSVPPSLSGHTLTLCSKAEVLLIGGHSSSIGFNNKVYTFNIERNEWSLANSTGADFLGLYGHTAICDDTTSMLYIFGGLHYNYTAKSGFSASNILYVYNVLLKRWSILHQGNHNRNEPVVSPRSFHSAVSVSQDGFRGFLVIGGQTDHNHFTSDLSLFQFGCDDWIDLELPKMDNQYANIFHEPAIGSGAASVTFYKNDNKIKVFVYGGINQGILQDTLQAFTLNSLKSSVCEIRTRTTTNCSEFRNCRDCQSWLPSGQGSYCKWCSTECSNANFSKPPGMCIPYEATCNGSAQCQQTKCSACDFATCSSCTSEGCHWNLAEPMEQPFYKCFRKSSFLNRALSYPEWMLYPVRTRRRMHPLYKQRCPAPCSTHKSCSTCFTSGGRSDDGLGMCRWSQELETCLSSYLAPLYCVGGLCGNVLQSMEACPLEDCETIPYCHDCIKHKHCGWLGLDDGSGHGQCRNGDYKSPIDLTPLPAYAIAQWFYIKCPRENECNNGHHNCTDPARFEVCSDLEDKYACVCQTGYIRNSSDEKCKPNCDPDCIHGNCTQPGVCQCAFGYTGSHCQTKCECNGHSDCLSSNPSHCIRCKHNTVGANCQFCEVGYVGDPSLTEDEYICIPCTTACHLRSSKCTENPNTHFTGDNDKESFIMHGPLGKKTTLCMGCSGNSEGRLCESCKDGYFELEGECRKCNCNGHGSTCDRKTGAFCKCGNHTKTVRDQCSERSRSNVASTPVPDDCWKEQCNDCEKGFKGQPVNGGFCYRKVLIDSKWCFDPSLESDCVTSDYRDKARLPAGQVALFAIHPFFTNVDIRILIDVTEGEVDVFVSDSDSIFDIRLNKLTGKQEVVFTEEVHVPNPQSSPYQSSSGKRKKRWFTTSPDVIVSDGSTGTGIRKGEIRKLTVQAEELNNYVTFSGTEALQARGLRDRLVVMCPHSNFELKQTTFYIIIVAQQVELPDNVSSSTDDISSRRQKRSSGPVLASATGQILFRQDLTQIDLFVFFSVFFSCFFLFLSMCIVAWKIKQAVDAQQARLAHHMQLQHMASRPFACAYVYLDRPSKMRCTNHPSKNYTKVSVNNPSTEEDVSTVNPLFQKHKNKPKASGEHLQSPAAARMPKRTFSSCSRKPSLSVSSLENRSPTQTFSTGSPTRYKCGDVARPRAGTSLDLSLLPDNNFENIRDSRRYSDNLDQLEKWAEAEAVHKRNLVVHCRSSDILEHRIPLLHTTSDYLTVIADADGNARLTPEVDCQELDPLAVSFKRKNSKTTFLRSLSIRFHSDQTVGESDFSGVTMPSSGSTRTLAKSDIFLSNSSALSKSNNRSSVTNEKIKLSKSKPHSNPDDIVEVGPLAFEPTADGLAGAATVALQLPGGDQMPYSLCLGTTLVTSKSLNLPLPSDFYATKVKHQMGLRKRF